MVISGYVLDLGAILSLRHGLPLAWVSSCWPLLQVLVAFTPAPHSISYFPHCVSATVSFLLGFGHTKNALPWDLCIAVEILFLQTVMRLLDSYHIKEDFPCQVVLLYIFTFLVISHNSINARIYLLLSPFSSYLWNAWCVNPTSIILLSLVVSVR